MKKLRIVFMGTPEFAVSMLNRLKHTEHEIVGVVTAPDKLAGRGMQLKESAVKKFAKTWSMNILQPEKLKSETFLNELKSLNADLFVVVAFRMLPEIVWSMPPLGTINVHASLLPQYRGAAPINWAIINGEKETGVTTFFIQHEIDTGKIIFQEKISIGDEQTAEELYFRLAWLGEKVLEKTVDAIASGDYPQVEQAHITEIKHAPKIFKETCRIDWNKDVDSLYNFIRGLSPYPAAFTVLGEKTFKIFKATRGTASNPSKSPGYYETDGKTFLRFYCNNGFLDVKECQHEGKKQMKIEEFLRGFAPKSSA